MVKENRSATGLLSEILLSGAAVTFFNTYRGLPVNDPGILLSLQEHTGLWLASRAQILCMSFDRQTRIRSSISAPILSAAVTSWNWQEEQVGLDSFAIIGDSIGQRANPRVEPLQPLRGAFYSHRSRKALRVEVAEISADGLAFYIHRAFFNRRSLHVGVEGAMRYLLPGGEVIQIGQVRYVVPGWGKQYYRIGIQAQAAPESAACLSAYVAARQVELQIEMEKLCKQE